MAAGSTGRNSRVSKRCRFAVDPLAMNLAVSTMSWFNRGLDLAIMMGRRGGRVDECGGLENR